MLFHACTTDLSEVKAITKEYDVSKDVGEKSRSFTAIQRLVKMTIDAPVIERYNDLADPKDVFPKDILISF